MSDPLPRVDENVFIAHPHKCVALSLGLRGRMTEQDPNEVTKKDAALWTLAFVPVLLLVSVCHMVCGVERSGVI